ncbi:hypothetical protein RJ639_021859 [Escallonia herrerae]|uniref:Uncharacterized protein n=1 Tax=Escallonia herrerae TaxID=1293975 RepID=A0AA89AH07_9ASTE|nr:hypothetical protein RJ639_021859 [Escallonia herrerae]
MVLSCQNGHVPPSWCAYNGSSCILGVLTIIYNVMEVKHHPFTRAASPEILAGSSKLPAFIKLDVNMQPKVHFTFKCIGHDSGNSSVHEEISSPAHHRDVPGLDHNRISSVKNYGPLIIRGVKNERKP